VLGDIASEELAQDCETVGEERDSLSSMCFIVSAVMASWFLGEAVALYDG